MPSVEGMSVSAWRLALLALIALAVLASLVLSQSAQLSGEARSVTASSALG